MSRDNFDAVLDHVFGSEGGYSSDRNDTGNWTGGQKGAGTFKGTKYGISAAAYPMLDIKNLTREQAKEIYQKDYWGAIKGDHLPPGMDLVAFDAAVNSGVRRGAKWLQRALGVTADAKIGPQTLKAAYEVVLDNRADEVIDRALDARLDEMKTFATWNIHKGGWTRRIKEVRAEAHKMAGTAWKPDGMDVIATTPVDQAGITQTFVITVKGAGPFEVTITEGNT